MGLPFPHIPGWVRYKPACTGSLVQATLVPVLNCSFTMEPNVQEWFAHAAAAAAAHAAAFLPAAAPAVVAPVAVKLPAFWVEDPHLWFAQAESIFRRSRVTVPLTQFDHVMAVLPQNLLSAVRILEQENPYKSFKAVACTVFRPHNVATVQQTH